MTEGGALHDLRVVDLTDDTGRFATKLLTEAGADVVRVGRGSAGPTMKGAAGEHGGLLDWWYDGGKQRLELDLETPDGQRHFKNLITHADLLIETEPPGRLTRLGIDFSNLQALNPRLVQVSLTPFGRQGPRAHWQISDLVAAALGGVLSVTGTPDAPLNGWGRQCFNTGGFFAAICGLAGVYAAREMGRGQHIDLSLQQSVLVCTEQVLMYWFFQKVFPIAIAPRQASIHWTGAFEVMPCASGYVMVTPGTHMPVLIDWLEVDGKAADLKDLDLTDVVKVMAHIQHIMEVLRAWAATKDAHDLFLAAQQRHLPFGEVLTVAEVANNPHLQARGFFRTVDWSGPEVKMPGSLFRTLGTLPPPPLPPSAAVVDSATVLQRWVPRPVERATASSGRKLLAGIRVLDFTWVLAGPYCTRVLADLGANVVKIQTESQSQGANSNAFPYFALWNRNKRSISFNMKHPRAVETFRRLAEQADVVVENFSVGVLERWGISYDAVRQWNNRIIYLSMAGAGQDGPWRDFVTYAPTIHALCGLTYLTNPPDRKDIGMGFALTDHLSGLAGALAILEALEARRQTGRGQWIDLSQLEVGTYLAGPALVDFLNNGHEVHPQGNADAFADHVPNNVYRCLADEWLALTARDDHEWRRLCAAIGRDELAASDQFASASLRSIYRTEIDEIISAWTAQQDAEQAMRQLQAAGIPAGKVQNMRDMTERDEQLAARQWLVEVENKLLGRHHLDVFPALFGETPLGPYAPAPYFGEHNFEVYAELLGMSEAEIAAAIGEGLFA
jgi:crotonobetainyl-CoA:carnitine CoA-transferase CaiB-like acyl-CoA transferase